MRTFGKTDGFSLVELVVVIVITVIVAALVVPRMLDRDIRAGWYQEQVTAAIRYAQRQAVAQRRQVFVDVQGAQVSLCYSAACGGTTLIQIANGAPYVLEAPSGVALSPVGVFSFDALGRPSAGQVISVAGQTITVHAETGYVQ
jgi:MSHA pilin protein MshC